MKYAIAKPIFILMAVLGLLLVQPASAITTNVTFGSFFYNPKSILIHVGDTITWTGPAGHTVTGTGAEAMCGPSATTSCSHTFQNVGAFAYQCNTLGHAGAGMTALVTVVAAPGNVAPSVSITSPASGAVFAAPANVKIIANATDSDGSVTNVQFFGGTTSLGSVTASPFNITANGLGAGSYALTAKATDNGGLSTTSAVVNISVVTPVAVSNFFPQVTNGQFVFDHTANPGLRYVVERSTALPNFSPVVTNTATSNSVHVTDSFTVGGMRFYRVGRLPNP
ncbi:MAG: cellulase family glycosylhydrolase [Pedosphaera sp.]|nr:cellulase family glycosylhydrolase [Pedosphaera sp.]